MLNWGYYHHKLLNFPASCHKFLSKNVHLHFERNLIIKKMETKTETIPYNSNMARLRQQTRSISSKEQNQREKHNLFSRKSRTKIRILHDAVKERADRANEENTRLKINVAKYRVFSRILSQKLGYEKIKNYENEWEKHQNDRENDPEIIPTQAKNAQQTNKYHFKKSSDSIYLGKNREVISTGRNVSGNCLFLILIL